MGFETSNELFINIKNPPVYDSSKHFFDQSIDVLQFWEEERKKIINGITIGGFYIHPWLYFHLNFFKTFIPGPNKTKLLINPPLDDNTFYVSENYQEAEQRNYGLVLFGTRGFTKSTTLGSISHWTSYIKSGGTMMIVGGDDGDLNSIATMIDTSMTNINAALTMPTITKDWDKSVKLGYKITNNVDFLHSELIIRNVSSGSKKKSEKSAGANPSGYIFDEIGKYDFLKSFEAALPSFETPYGYNLVPILSGTSGNVELSKDARIVLEDPESYRMLPMNWDRLERGVPDDCMTWKKSRGTNFGTFVPGQMSQRIKVQKLDSNLGDFLKSDNKLLKEIPIRVTDWKKATEYLLERNDKFKKNESKDKDKMYYPLDTPDCFLTEGANPFPVLIIEKKIRELEEDSSHIRHIDIYKDGSSFKYEFSQKKLADQHYEGKAVSAAIKLYGDFPEKKPDMFRNTAGMDDYKHDAAENSNSWGSVYVLQRRHMELNCPCEKIVMSSTERPNRHEEAYLKWEEMLEVTNAQCLIESADTGFLTYLRPRFKDEKLLAPAISFANNGGRKGATQYGLYPNTWNNKHRMDALIDHTWEEFKVGLEEDGTPIIKYGVEFIDDVELLKEMLEYKKGVNLDRIAAYSHALVQCQELDRENIRPKTPINYDDYESENESPAKPSYYTTDKRVRRKY